MSVEVPYALKRAMNALGIKRGEERGLYAPLAKRYPLRIDDEIPKRVKELLVENHTCACTDSNIVYVDTELAKEMFKRVAKRDFVDSSDAEDNYQTLLAHEYTHILMQHVKKGIKFCRANGYKNYPIFALACDIEANRGYRIVASSKIYKIAVSDDSYPECKGVEGLMNIYRVLKKYYGDEINKNYEELRRNMGDEGEDEEGEGEEGEEDKEGNSSDGSTGQPDADAERRKQAMKDAMEGIEKMKEEMEKVEATLSSDELEENLEQYDEKRDIEDIAYGSGSDSEGLYSATPNLELHDSYDAYVKREMDKITVKLRTLVKGEQVKTRVKTYSRQSRRTSEDGLIRKGVKNAKALAPKILVAMDSSGSMDVVSVTPVANTIGTIAKTLGRTKGSWICEHDGAVKNLSPLTEWEKVVEAYQPCGDNCFDNVLRVALEKKVDVVIDVGDGMDLFRDKELMKRAKEKGIRWVDIIVSPNANVDGAIAHDEMMHGDDYIGREIIVAGV